MRMSVFLPSPGGLHLPDQFLATPRSGHQATAGFSGFGGGSGYSAANQSTARSYVYFPELRTNNELSQQGRTAILRKARWLPRNVPLAARFRDGIAEMVGYLTPRPATTDLEWNEEILQLFNDIAGSPQIFDSAGIDNFYTRQITLSQLFIQDGDCGLAFTYDDYGNPQTQLYQSPQISRAGYSYAPYTGDGWHDGVYLNRSGRPEKFALLDENLTKQAAEIDARNFLLFANLQPGCSARGVSVFAPFADRMIDIREIENHQSNGIKTASLMGIVLTNQSLQGTDQNALMESFVAGAAYGAPAATTERSKFNLEQITRPGGNNIAQLDLGQKIETIHDDRPHPNAREFVNALEKAMCMTTGFPSEIILGMQGLTGPAVRFTMKQGDRAAGAYRNRLREVYCKRVYAWFCATMINAGRIRAPKDRRFWAAEWIGPASLTIDAGRDVSSGLAELETGNGTLKDYMDEESKDWKRQIKQRGIELQYYAQVEKELGLEPGSMRAKPQVIFQPAPPPGQNDPAEKTQR